MEPKDYIVERIEGEYAILKEIDGENGGPCTGWSGGQPPV